MTRPPEGGEQAPRQHRRTGRAPDRPSPAPDRRAPAPEPPARGRRPAAGAATAGIARPDVRPAPRTSASERKRGGDGVRTARRGRRYGENGVASLGEARAHRRWREERERARRGARPDPRQRARRTIKTTKPLINRFAAGRPRFRLIATLVAMLVVLVAVLAKVGLMQGGGRAEALRSAGQQQWTRDRVLPAQRGAIFDRNGDELALSVPATTIAVNPMQVEDALGTARMLSQILGMTPEEERELAVAIEDGAGRSVGFLYVARQIDPTLAQQVDALGLVGVSTYPEDRRIMPGGQTGQSVVGRTDIDGVGTAGLELQFHELLQGQPGQMTLEVAPGGRSIAGTEQIVQAPVPGLDLITSLDRSVQYAVEQALVRQVNLTSAQGGQVIVMLTNGDIVAMASVERDDRGVAVVSSGNWAAVGSYEPGSVGKIITVAGALEDGAVTPETGYLVPWQHDCTDDPTNGILSDSHQHGPMAMSVNDILVESSNVGTIYVSNEITYEREYHYLTAFGLGEVSGLGFPGESAGLLKPWQQWEGTERCTVAYGQGLASTPIQLAAAVNVIANDGTYVAPRLVTGTVGADGEMTAADPPSSHYVVSTTTAAQVQQMMENVVCQSNGTAHAAQVEGLAVAGKTGTAYKAQADGTYWNAQGKHDYYSSFVGFFPADDPQVTVLVSIDEPGSGFNSGAQSAAPLFRDLVPTIRHELGIVPPPGSTDCDGS